MSPPADEGGEHRLPSVDVHLPPGAPTEPPPEPAAPAPGAAGEAAPPASTPAATEPPSPPSDAPTPTPTPAVTTAPVTAPAATVAAAAPVPRDRRPLALANHALGRSEIAFLVMLAIGQALAFGQDLIGGIARSNVTVARIGGLYVFASLRVPIQLRASASGVRGTFIDLSLAFLTITAVGVVLLFRGADSVGARAGGGLVRRALWGATVGLPFGLMTFLLSLLVGFHFHLPVTGGGEVAIGVSKPWAAVLPAVLGIAIGAAGGMWSGLSRVRATQPAPAGARPPGAGTQLAAGAFAGAWRMFVAALGLSFVALLVLAGLKPDATRAYIDGTALRGASGVDLLAHHVLALPNQSMFVLVPAMGGCDRVQGTGEPRAFLCPSKFPQHGTVNLTAPLLPGRRKVLTSPFAGVRFGQPLAAFRLFLLVPLAAAIIGGIRAARPARSRSLAAGAGALAGVGFAGLVVLGCLAAGVTLRLYGAPPQQPVSLSILPDPVTGGLLGLAWGALGGALGAFAGWRQPVKNAPRPAADATPAVPAPTAP